jgi:predicted ABC-type ATPase
VRRRVAAGGQDIPEPIIRRRFVRSLECLETRYKPIVEEWHIYDSLEGEFRLAETWNAP